MPPPAPPSYVASAASQYFIPNTPILINAAATWHMSIFRDDIGADATLGWTLGLQSMSKVTGHSIGGNTFYGAYIASPLTGLQRLDWIGVSSPYASARYSIDMTGVGGVGGSGYFYDDPGVGGQSFAVTIPSDINSVVFACFNLPAPQNAAVLTPLAGCTIRTDFVGDFRHVVVTAPGAASVQCGFTSSVKNFAGLGGYGVNINGVAGQPVFLKIKIKLRGT